MAMMVRHSTWSDGSRSRRRASSVAVTSASIGSSSPAERVRPRVKAYTGTTRSLARRS
jgi:hypothetical protein